jgi:hypothetical protein
LIIQSVPASAKIDEEAARKLPASRVRIYFYAIAGEPVAVFVAASALRHSVAEFEYQSFEKHEYLILRACRL